MGIAYKPDVSDDRESASLEVIRRLTERGAHVAVLDPHIEYSRIESHGFEVADQASLESYDLAVILTDHTSVPYEGIAESVPQVFDSRGIYRRLGLAASNVEAL